MKTWILGLIATVSLNSQVTAQCAAPASITTTTANIICRSSGRISVTGVKDAIGNIIDTASCRYSLWDKSNTTQLRVDQSTPVFNGLDSGTYTLRVWQVCTAPAGVSTYDTAIVRLKGYYTDPVMGPLTATVASSPCSNDGKITIGTTTKGVTPYLYCLVDSAMAPAAPVHYVAGLQSSNVFSGLPAGDYYVRVYDACSGYVTSKITISAKALPVFTGSVDLVRKSCDSLELRAYTSPSVIYNTLQRSWVVYPDGTVDSMNSVSASTYISYTVRWSRITTYPATFTLYYTDICGNVKSVTKVVNKPKFYLKPLTASNYDCSTGYFTLSTRSSYGGVVLYDSSNNYVNAEVYPFSSYSLDSGKTWMPYKGDSAYLANGTSMQLQFMWCGQVYTTVLSATLPTLSLHVWEYARVACTSEKSGMYFGSINSTGSADSIWVEVIKRPATQDSIPPFYMNYSNTGGILPQLLNIDTGSYTVRFTDKCNTTTYSIRLSGAGFTLPVARASIKPCATYVTLYLGDTTNQYSSTPLWARRRFIITNSTNTYLDTLDILTNGSTLGLVIDSSLTNLPPDIYTVKTYQLIGKDSRSSVNLLFYATDTVCGMQTLTIDARLPAALSLSKSLFTTCTNDTLLGSVIAVPAGGSGPYNYTIYQDSVSAGNKVAGPQSGNIFNNLAVDKIYVITAQDQCGSGTAVRSALSNVKPVTTPSTTQQPCPGDAITLSVDSTAGLTYQWSLNGNLIADATHSSYTIKSMSIADSGRYVADINAGTCLLLSRPILLNPAQCGATILAIDLLSFSGDLNVQSNAVLRWSIGRPEKGGSFEIMYSTDGSNFKPAGAVLQDGQATSFSFVHQNYRVSSKTYYRLLITSPDGHQQYSNTLMLQGDGMASSTLSVTPVPFTSYINVSYTATHDCTVVLTITDVNGRILHMKETAVTAGTNSIALNGLESMPSGVYLLCVTDNNGNRQVIKVQK